jgi:Arc/MetJ-type ribon-helix-helix transcriptional regulator
MARTGQMTKQVAVRLDERTLRHLEEVRDPGEYPTQSDFVREAIRRMIREERRKSIAAEIERLMRDPEEVRLQQELAEAGMAEWVARLEAADRGEL